MNSEVNFISLTPEALLSDRGWWEIYDESFPPTERELPEVILRSLRQEVGLALSARSSERTVGIATTHLLQDPPAVFLVYLAIARDLRGSGVGGPLLEFASRTSADKLSQNGLEPAGLILEVDALETPDDAAEKRVRERRVAFFQRHGLNLLSGPYMQPPIDGITPVVMNLMFRSFEDQSQPDPDQTKRLVRAIYFEKYHAMNGIPRESLDSLLGD